tara:strand:+ start:121281 stop:122282 length:1002 start_codon:yes stop_codon:yes gene_type:complete
MFKNTFVLFICTLIISVCSGQEKILVFTKTNGFRHSSIEAGVDMITNLGNDNGFWQTDHTEDPAAFTTENLAQYAAVIWCNTTGDGLLNADQQAAFENFINDGGGYVGIHSATDTYRDGSWPFYNELVGAIIQTSPSHTSNDHLATMTVLNSHPAVDFMGDSYTKVEEYYYWKINGGYIYPENINLLEVERTGDNDYDEPRPISWYKEYEGGRSFYTAMGHNASDYTDDATFIKHVEEGIKYVLKITLNVSKNGQNMPIFALPNPFQNNLQFQIPADFINTEISVSNMLGQNIFKTTLSSSNLNLDTSSWPRGLYVVRWQTDSRSGSSKLLKQ